MKVVGAVPAWLNYRGEQVMKVMYEYWRGGEMVGTGHEFMTTQGSTEVRANDPTL